MKSGSAAINEVPKDGGTAPSQARATQAPLAIIETHPVQYHAPVYRAVAEKFGIPVKAIYGSDFSVRGYLDREFGSSFAWDVDLTGGMETEFLARAASGGAASLEEVSAKGLGAALDAARPSAVLVTGYQPAFYLAALWEAKRRRLPVLFRAETTDHARARSSLKSFARDFALRRLYGMCARVLPIGMRSREHYCRLGAPDWKMIASPYCVSTLPFRCEERDRDRLRGEMRRELDLAPGDFGVIFSGKLSARKGVHALTAAVKALPEALRRKVALLFLGAGQERNALEETCAKTPAVRARFIGFRNQTELSPYYHAADLLCLPSIELETWGLVVNEALHHGLPCVVSDAVGCADDLIEPGVTGEIAAAGDAASLAGAMEKAARLTGDGAVRAQCREKIAGYSVERAAEGIAQAYRSVVEARS